MASYKDLTARINALQARAEVVRKQEAAKIVKQVRATIAAYGLTAEDLGVTQSKVGQGPVLKPKAPIKTGLKGPSGRPSSQVKYRDDQGNTWSGRGPKPGWLKTGIAGGKALEEFEVKAAGRASAAERTGGKTASSKPKPALPVKWRDDAGHTWSGRGTKPAWFKAALEAGKTLEELAA